MCCRMGRAVTWRHLWHHDCRCLLQYIAQVDSVELLRACKCGMGIMSMWTYVHATCRARAHSPHARACAKVRADASMPMGARGENLGHPQPRHLKRQSRVS